MPRSPRLLAPLAAGLLALAAPADDKPPAGITIDQARKTVAIDARVAPRKLPHLQEVYPIEVIACFAYKEGVKGKAHETVLTTAAKPSDVHKALESLGLKPGKPARGEGAKADGPEVNVFIEVPQPGGTAKRLTLDRVLIDPKTRKPMPKGVKVKFTGSAMAEPDPSKSEKVYGADVTGTLLALFPVTDETVLQTSLTMAEEKYLKLEVNKDVLPKEGEAVRLVLQVPGGK
jgi:hypothetical protein